MVNDVYIIFQLNLEIDVFWGNKSGDFEHSRFFNDYITKMGLNLLSQINPSGKIGQPFCQLVQKTPRRPLEIEYLLSHSTKSTNCYFNNEYR